MFSLETGKKLAQAPVSIKNNFLDSLSQTLGKFSIETKEMGMFACLNQLQLRLQSIAIA